MKTLKEFLIEQDLLFKTDPQDSFENLKKNLLFAYKKLKEQRERLEKESKNYKKKVFDLFTLFDVGKDLTSSLDVDVIMQVVILTARAQMKAKSVHLFLREEDETNTIKLVKSTTIGDEDSKSYKLSTESEFLKSIAEINKPVLIETLGNIEEYTSIISGLKAVVVVPLLAKEKITGLIFLGEKRSKKGYSEDDFTFLSTISSFASASFENARLYNKVNRQLLLISGLYEISEIMNSSTDMEQVKEMVMETITTGFKAEVCSLMLNRNENFEIVAARGLSEFTINNYRVKVEEGLEGMASQKGEPCFINDFNKDEFFIKNFDIADRQKIKSGMIVPLKAGEKVVGVLDIYKFSREQKLDADLKKLFSIISSQLTPAILMASMLDEQKKTAVDSFSYIEERIKREIENTKELGLSFSILKLGFQNIRLEHLVIMNEYLKTFFRESDMVIRIGLSSYFIVMPMMGNKECNDFCSGLILPDDLVKANVSFSFKVASYPEDGEDNFVLLKKLEF